MAGRAVVPVHELTQRAPEHGRIRIGEKHGKAMRSIDTFRFTSSDADAIAELASLYGGEVAPFDSGRGVVGWEVKTEASEIPVLLPPDPLAGTPIYELWSGGGLARRCDGAVAQIPGGDEPLEGPCICASKQALECKPVTRLNVILREIRFGGTWRLETKGWNAAHEMPGMVGLITDLQARGLASAILAIEKRQQVANGKKKNFVVPVLRVPDSADAMLSGELGAGRQAHLALEAGAPDGIDPTVLPQLPEPDDEIVEAEIVDDFAIQAKPSDNPLLRTMFALLAEAGIDRSQRAAFALAVTKGRTGSTRSLTDEELTKVCAVLQDIADGKRRYEGADDHGRAVVR